MKNSKKLAQPLKKYSKNKEKIYFFLEIAFFFLIAFAGIYFRLFKVKELMFFGSDVGTEFAVIQEIKATSRFPLIGPEIGILNFNSPPTYFLILLFFSTISSPENIVYFYVLINILTVAILFSAIWIFTDKKTSLMMFPLFAFNSSFIYQSRQIWHPHPVAFFFSSAILFSFLAQKYKKIIFIFFSVIFYLIATSIYISPIIFFPYFFYIACKFYREKYSKVTSFFFAVGTFFIGFFPLYISQIIYEILNNFPSLSSFTQSKQVGFNSLGNFLTILGNNISMFFREMLLGGKPVPFVLTVSLFSYVMLVYIKNLKEKKEVLGGFIIAFLIVLFFNPDTYTQHRLNEVFIFSLLIIAQAFFLIKKMATKRALIAAVLLIGCMSYNHLSSTIDSVIKLRESSHVLNNYFLEKIEISKKIKNFLEENKISSYFLLNTTDQKQIAEIVFASKIDFLKRDIYMEQYFSFSYWALMNQQENKPVFPLDGELNQFKYHHINDILQKENILYLCLVGTPVEECLNPDLKKGYSFKKEYPLNDQIYLAHFRRNYIRY